MPRRLLTEIMGGYLDGTDEVSVTGRDFSPPFRLVASNRMPVVPKNHGWAEDKERRCLTRRYDFKDHNRMSDFIHELLHYESETGHYGRIECDFPAVTINVKTHDLDSITEVDRDYAAQCDRIYDDVGHYGYNAQDEIY